MKTGTVKVITEYLVTTRRLRTILKQLSTTGTENTPVVAPQALRKFQSFDGGVSQWLVCQ